MLRNLLNARQRATIGRSDSQPGDAMAPRVAFAVLAAGLAVALALAQPAVAAPSAKKGEALAKANCAACHAIGRKGASPNEKAPPFRRLSEFYPVESLQEALAEGISVGHEGMEMPEFQFTPARIDDLTAWLKTINRKR